MRVTIDESGKVHLAPEACIDGTFYVYPPEIVASVQEAVDAIGRGEYEEVDLDTVDD